MENVPLDTAAEPVDHIDDAEFMDTGVLHQRPKKRVSDKDPETEEDN